MAVVTWDGSCEAFGTDVTIHGNIVKKKGTMPVLEHNCLENLELGSLIRKL